MDKDTFEVDDTTANTAAPSAEGGKSIVDPAYRERMKGASDWIGEFMESQALNRGVGAREAVEEIKDAEGNVVEKGKAAVKGKNQWDLDRIFALAEANFCDTAKYADAREKSSGVGRMRMTIGNMLRSRAKKRHGLYDIEGNWVEAPEDFLADAEGNIAAPTENPDGTKIPKAKDEKPTDAGSETPSADVDAGPDGDFDISE